MIKASSVEAIFYSCKKGSEAMTIDLRSELQKRILVLDGAMGTMLQQQGLGRGECPEIFNLTHPKILEDIHSAYIEAGSDIIQTNTFGANRFKLSEYGLGDKVEEINSRAVEIARRAAGGRALVALSAGPSGKLFKPLGEVEFDDLFEAFSIQFQAAEKAGADLISIETMTDIAELRVAVIAALNSTRLPVLAHLTFEPDGRTLMGTDPVTAVLMLEALGITAVGANCSGGAVQLLPIIEQMAQTTSLFISVEPNAGLPTLVGEETVFPETPEEMGHHALALREAGANIIGGCCGTTPDHIKAMAEAVRGLQPASRKSSPAWAFCSRTRHVVISDKSYPSFIGERINPTARKKLAQDIKDGHMEVVVEEARKQAEAGAPILDVNMGVPGIDEPAAMIKAVREVQTAIDIPIVIDSTNPEAIEAALKTFVGRPLINSTTGEEKSLDRILPLAKKYGAAVLGLCLAENGIPASAEGRLAIAEKIYSRAREYGLRDQDVFIDCLVKTASAEQDQVMETLKTLQAVKSRLGLKTVLGASNVSHGLPARDVLNSTYLAMAMAYGLDLPIMNPFEERMQDVIRASAVLMNRDSYASSYIEYYKDRAVTAAKKAPPVMTTTRDPAPSVVQNQVSDPLKEAIVKGQKGQILDLIKQALEDGQNPMDIINKYLIPGIEEVGDLYDRKVYFLPQLMLSAETMKEGFNYLKPLLIQENQVERGTIVLATVEGDIHDIGKNIVGIMLENYGYRVIDLGKDVPAPRIVATAIEENADIIGLSALMTTTMSRMKEVIDLVKSRELKTKVIVGGAVLTRDYAEKIGAHGYSPDARAAVVTVNQLIKA